MMKRAVLIVFVLAGLSAMTLHAQRAPGIKPPIKWGDIPQEHLDMNHYAPDTNAAVVILADYGDVYFEGDGEMVFERHRRIKILSEAGYDWGTVSIPYYVGKDGQRVRSIKGQTFTPGSGGKAVRHKMDKKSIFIEEVDKGWKRVRFTLPALEPGAVIEYSYRLETDNPIFLPNWEFQSSEPTLWSEYRAEIPGRYQYVMAFVGRPNFVVEEAEPHKIGRATRHRWAMQNVPSLREEPFMTAPKDYRAAIRFQLSSYSDPYVGRVDFMNTWEGVAEDLIGRLGFGQQAKPSRKVRQQAEALTAGLSTPLDKMIALYDFVRTTITWDGERSYFPDQSGNDVLKTQSATSGEIVMLLVAMLRAAEIEAHPVLISTRSHGQVIEVYPILDQFNDMLVAALIGGKTYLLDATDPLRPHTLLSHEALNGKGWLVRSPNPTWIAIKATGRYQHKSFLNATLDASGTLAATLQTSDGGYSALNKRYQLKEAETLEAFVKDVLLEGLEEVQIDSCAVTNADLVSESLKTESTFSIPAYALVAGDFIYFNPMPVGPLTENPLRLPERTFPVDMAYPRSFSYTVRLRLPEGYAVQELPQNIETRLPLEGGHFLRKIAADKDMLIVQAQFVTRRSVYKAQHYKYLRSFFEQVVTAQAEQVVLKRVTENEPDGGADQ